MLKRCKVIVADDSPSIRAKLKENLTDKGFEIIEASDGIDCILKVFKHFPNFVVLDVKMPKINGYQACRFIKNHPKTSHIPVMLLTALDKPIDELWGYATGADIYRSKSTKIETIVADVEKCIQEHPVIEKQEHIDITETDILSFLNDILDNRLFELTLINEITALSFKINDLDLLVTKCSQFLNKITNFYCIGFLLEYEERVKVYLYSIYEYGEQVEEFITYLKETLRDLGYTAVDFVYNIGIEKLPTNYHEKRKFVFIDNVLDKADSHNRNMMLGGVAISLKSEDTNLKNINFLLNTVLLVIHNCMLYHKILDLSIIDELTSLYNRRKIMEILKTEIERSERYNYDLSVILCDVDDFKKVNDTYGHKMGDVVLKKVSTVLKNSLRKVDFVGRFGGEEFLIVSPQTTINNAVMLAERIRRVLESVTFEGLDRRVTISMGISSFESGKDIDKLINEADVALYKAKYSGKNSVKW